MSALFEELDHVETPMGELSLRRRKILSIDTDVLEVKLGEEFLMSSLFTVGERALAQFALAAHPGSELDVVVGGLGLGYTAMTVLKDPRVRSLKVVEALTPVIDWHRRGLAPLGPTLCEDHRTDLVEGDFFAFVRGAAPLKGATFDLILLDIDHSPAALLSPAHRGFYTPEGLAQAAQRLRPGGVFAMWSDASPDPDFLAALGSTFVRVRPEVVEFDNPLQARKASCTIYLAHAER